MTDSYECTSCGKELTKSEEHSFYDCLEFVKKENADLEVQLKASQQQLAEARVRIVRLDNALDNSMLGYNVQEGRANRRGRRITKLNKEIADLRAQLAEAKELYEIAEEGRVLFMDQLATSTIAVDAAKKFMEKAETERDEAQAEVERLREENTAIEEHIAEHGVIR